MDKKTFKNILKKCLVEIGFTRYKTWYILDCKDLFIGIKDLKSNFSELFYIDYGIFVKSRWKDESYKEKNPYYAEIRSRIGYCDLEKEIDEVKYEKQLRKELQDKIVPLKIKGESYLREKVCNDKDDFLLIMPEDELKEWSLKWTNILKNHK